MPRNSAPSIWSIDIAKSAAVGHFHTGLYLYHELESRLRKSCVKREQPDFTNIFELMIPATTNLSLAVELFLKVHYFQLTTKYPAGHDIREIVKRFPQDRLDNLRNIYHELYNSPRASTGLEVRYASSLHDHPKRGVRTHYATFESAVEYIGLTYVNWRYIYEHFHEKFDVHMAFTPLYYMSKCLFRAIMDYPGALTVNPPSGQVYWNVP